MRDLKRVKEYIDLGYEPDKAIEMVDAEMENEPTPEPINNPQPDMSGYISKEEAEKQIKEAVEEERRKQLEVEPLKEENNNIDTLMSRFF